jgi:hypothetical protein
VAAVHDALGVRYRRAPLLDLCLPGTGDSHVMAIIVDSARYATWHRLSRTPAVYFRIDQQKLSLAVFPTFSGASLRERNQDPSSLNLGRIFIPEG